MDFGFDRASDTFGQEIQTITVNSLEELMDIVNKEGKVIIYPKDDINNPVENMPAIMIYDTYIE